MNNPREEYYDCSPEGIMQAVDAYALMRENIKYATKLFDTLDLAVNFEISRAQYSHMSMNQLKRDHRNLRKYLKDQQVQADTLHGRIDGMLRAEFHIPEL